MRNDDTESPWSVNVCRTSAIKDGNIMVTVQVRRADRYHNADAADVIDKFGGPWTCGSEWQCCLLVFDASGH